MKPVNLLPERHRPRTPTGSRKGSSYFVLGALGVVLLGLVVYVLTVNSINSSKDKIATAQAEAARANAEAAALGPYGDFAKVKQQRVDAVTQLATGRFDFERLVRELNYVLPEGVWINSMHAADSAADAQSGGTSGSSITASGSGPVVQLTGCAPSQGRVAVTMVRARELQGAVDVSLEHSTKADNQSSGGGSSASTAGSSSTGCGLSSGHVNYEFAIDVSFAPVATANTHAPSNLGGGS